MTAVAPSIDVTEAVPPSAGDKAEHVMLSGPHSRLRELWLLLGTVADFLRGFRALHFVGPCVTVFGSASEADDIAWGIVYLASDGSKFVTGAELVIDGGYTAR